MARQSTSCALALALLMVAVVCGGAAPRRLLQEGSIPTDIPCSWSVRCLPSTNHTLIANRV